MKLEKTLPIGKLDSDILEKSVFTKIKYKRSEVVSRAGIGEDCAAVDFGEYDCVVSTDPITASVSDVGRLAIFVSCNDIATNGIQPLAILLTVMLPVGTTQADVEKIMEQAAEAARACEVEIVGGHTEITDSVKQPIIVSTAFGRRKKAQKDSEKTRTLKDVEEGDLLFVTKNLGIEGTGIIAAEKEEELKTKADFTDEDIKEAKDFLNDVGVVKEGLIAGRVGVIGMHDITEGGVLGAVWELCAIAGAGAVLQEAAMPVAAVTQKLCAVYGINPLRLISSGSMLIIAKPEKAESLKAAMACAGVELTCIGAMAPRGAKVMLETAEGTMEEVAPPAADELYLAVGLGI